MRPRRVCENGAPPRNTFNFHEQAHGKGYFNGGPGGLMGSERLFVDAVDDSKVVHRLEEYLKKSPDTKCE